MTVVKPDMKQVAVLGWRQGSSLSTALTRQILEDGHFTYSEDINSYRLVIISQDCDLVNSSLEAEPWCEAIVIRSIDAIDGNFMAGKSNRKMHLSVTGHGYFECSIHTKLRFPREYLLQEGPDPDFEVGEKNLRFLKIWLAKRYTRTAFPDNFNDRYKGVQRNVIKAFRPVGELIEEVFILTESGELPPGTDYTVFMIAAMADDIYDQEGNSDLVEGALHRVEDLLEGCTGIEVIRSTVRPRREISLSEIDVMKRWDYLDPISSSL